MIFDTSKEMVSVNMEYKKYYVQTWTYFWGTDWKHGKFHQKISNFEEKGPRES